MKSTINLEIEIIHDEPLTVDAQTLAAVATRATYLAALHGEMVTEGVHTFGRRSLAGAEDQPNVSTFLRSAAIHAAA